MSGKNKRDILFISDLHIPYHHPDALAFLAALAAKYKFGRVVCVGDELDWHALSYHDKSPDLHSAGDELAKARGTIRELYRLFPLMDIIESNHGSLSFRKAVTHGFPRHTMTSYADTLFVGGSFSWHVSTFGLTRRLSSKSLTSSTCIMNLRRLAAFMEWSCATSSPALIRFSICAPLHPKYAASDWMVK